MKFFWHCQHLGLFFRPVALLHLIPPCVSPCHHRLGRLDLLESIPETLFPPWHHLLNDMNEKGFQVWENYDEMAMSDDGQSQYGSKICVNGIHIQDIPFSPITLIPQVVTNPSVRWPFFT